MHLLSSYMRSVFNGTLLEWDADLDGCAKCAHRLTTLRCAHGAGASSRQRRPARRASDPARPRSCGRTSAIGSSDFSEQFNTDPRPNLQGSLLWGGFRHLIELHVETAKRGDGRLPWSFTRLATSYTTLALEVSLTRMPARNLFSDLTCDPGLGMRARGDISSCVKACSASSTLTCAASKSLRRRKSVLGARCYPQAHCIPAGHCEVAPR